MLSRTDKRWNALALHPSTLQRCAERHGIADADTEAVYGKLDKKMCMKAKPDKTEKAKAAASRALLELKST